MNRFLRFVQFLTLGGWIGAIFYFAAVLAPGVFRLLAQDQAGLLIEFTLWRLHVMGEVAAVTFLFASIVLAVSGAKRLIWPALCVMVMLALTMVSQHVVIRRMIDLRQQMISVASTPPSNPLRAEFDRLHGVSVDLEGVVLLVGLASLFLCTSGETKEM